MRNAWRPVLGALLVLLTFPPANFSLLVFVALVPWLWDLRERSGKGAWKSGYLFGLVFGIGQLHWLYVLATTWTHSPGLALVPWALASAAMALYFGWMGVLIRRCWVQHQPWMIPLVWAGMEVFRSYIPVFAFPYGLLAGPLWRFPWMIQSAHYGSIFLVSAWIVLANLLLMGLLLRRHDLRLKLGAVAFFVVLGLSLLRLGESPPSVRKVITACQPGVNVAFGSPDAVAAQVALNVTPLLRAAEHDGTALFVLPEGIGDARYGNAPATSFPITGRVPLLFGSQRGRNPSFQSAFAFDGRWQHADKTRLVIFGEFVPGRSWIPFLDRFNLPTGDLSASRDGVKTLDIGRIRVGPVICFEGLFPDISYQHAVHGAQLLAVLSIDDWFLGTGASEQLEAGSVWRAVETGLPLVRAASLGRSIVVDAHGRVVAEAPLRKPMALRVALDLPKSPQAFPLWAGFPVGSLAFLIVPFFHRGERKTS